MQPVIILQCLLPHLPNMLPRPVVDLRRREQSNPRMLVLPVVPRLPNSASGYFCFLQEGTAVLPSWYVLSQNIAYTLTHNIAYRMYQHIADR
ncbi:hypothetical protein CIK84_06315 [Glutamicibacter arilaitensis]|uniref:Uncharacterized protein n=1 Tax=Glutamicibacter arilaitensis TaxID=256701 RepID=A0A2N7S4U5_9MICC|nr:hypothetical protein CIK84_06315 [Glutamicibacter arilaitensis]